jgi:hypothetical protein
MHYSQAPTVNRIRKCGTHIYTCISCIDIGKHWFSHPYFPFQSNTTEFLSTFHFWNSLFWWQEPWLSISLIHLLIHLTKPCFHLWSLPCAHTSVWLTLLGATTFFLWGVRATRKLLSSHSLPRSSWDHVARNRNNYPMRANASKDQVSCGTMKYVFLLLCYGTW